MDENEIHWLVEKAFKASLAVLAQQDTLLVRSRFYMRILMMTRQHPMGNPEAQLSIIAYLERKLHEIREQLVVHQKVV